MIKKIFSLTTLLLLLPIYAEENPYAKLEFTYNNPVVLRVGGEIDFEVKVNLPPKHFLYLSHVNSNGIGVITTFNFPVESGFQLLEVNRPKGIKKQDEMILKNKGNFSFKIFDLGIKKVESNTKVPFSIRTQLCEEKENGICYPPKTITKEVILQIKDGRKMLSLRNIEVISWEPTFESAIAKAKSSHLNIYAIITEPSWCGACRYMEKEAFDKPEVQKVLKEKFIPWKVKEDEYNKVPTGSGSFGIPIYFVLDQDSKSLGKWSGAKDAKALLSVLKPFEKSTNPEDPFIPSPSLPSEDSTELEIQSADGSKCVVTYGKDYPWTSTKAGEFYNSGTFRFGINNREIKVKQFTRDLSPRKAYEVMLTKFGFRIRKTDLNEFWVFKCKESLLKGKLEGSDIEIFLEN